jgi:hypothetical protein
VSDFEDYGVAMVRTSARSVAGSAHSNTGFRAVARLGFAVNGLLHVLIGAIAISVAVGAGAQTADQSGALGQLAATPGGVFLLWVIVVGLFALALWGLIYGVLMPQGEDRKASKRVSAAGKAIAYAAVAATALTFANGSSSSSSQSTTSFSATVLSAPGGPFLLVLVGLLVIGIGVYFVAQGARNTFTRDIRVPSGSAGTATRALAKFGYIAKGIALAVVGILFIVGAVTFNPGKATGLDGALKALAALPFGTFILIAVGIGLIAYGVYCGIRARLAKL